MPHNEEEVLAKAEQKGRKGDALLGHLTPGDIIIPGPRVTPEMLAFLQSMMDVDVYTAGHERNSLNPYTGLPEFQAEADAGFHSGGFDGGGFLGGGYSPENDAATSGDTSGLGMPSGVDASNSFGGGFAPGDFLGGGYSPEADLAATGNTTGLGFGLNLGAGMDQGFDATNEGGMGGMDIGQPLSPTPLANPVAPRGGPPPPPLPARMTPDVVNTLPQIGKYFQAMRSGDYGYARNLLAPYLQQNLYGK